MRSELTIEGRTLQVSNLDKVLYPELGFTKAQVLDYYARIAPRLLPHLRGRALTLKRFPEGVDRSFFFEKHAPSHRPEWVATATVFDLEYVVVNDVASLLWVANLAALELHVPLALAEHPDRPTAVVFDLDPGEPAAALDCAMVALRLRKRLANDGIECWVKSSGQKGLQLYCMPPEVLTSFDTSKTFAREIAMELSKETPATVVAEMEKVRRSGKVFIDWGQNDAKKTTICVYSMRATPAPQVSAPIAWPDIEAAVRMRHHWPLIITAPEALARDVPWLPVASPPRTKRSRPKSKG